MFQPTVQGKGTFIIHSCGDNDTVVSVVMMHSIEDRNCSCGCGDRQRVVVAHINCAQCDEGHEVVFNPCDYTKGGR